MAHKVRAFTLLELLVVITIMVVLLAMLVPALEKAIYEAELVVCAGQFKGLAQAVSAYTVDQRQFYPDRSLEGSNSNQITALDGNDDRPILRYLFPINQILNDPLGAQVDLETKVVSSQVYAGEQLYFGFSFEGYGGVVRMGDRLEWIEDIEADVIAADHDQMLSNVAWATAGHPDRAGRMIEQASEDESIGVGQYETRSYWWDNQTWRRAPLDLNYAFIDGSVQRIDDVAYNDQRMWVIPAISAKVNWPTGPHSTDGWYTLVPK